MGRSRKQGNTEIQLDAALEKVQENGVLVSKICLKDKIIVPCIGVWSVRERAYGFNPSVV